MGGVGLEDDFIVGVKHHHWVLVIAVTLIVFILLIVLRLHFLRLAFFPILLIFGDEVELLEVFVDPVLVEGQHEQPEEL